jgi:predicted histone-like DNA-binding protein
MSYQELCKHMSEHNSVYGEDVCLGVANKLQNCMLEQLLEGKKVQFGELGVFYLSVKSTGANTEKDFNLGVNINGLFLCFAPSRTDVNNLSSKMLKKKATFMNVKDLSETKPKTSNTGTGNENQNENGGGSSSSGSSSAGSETGGNSGNPGTVNPDPSNPEPSAPKLTINRSGSGSSSVSVNGSTVNSGAEIVANTEVSVSITPAEGTTPTANLDGTPISLTESEGVYSGTFQMPGTNATLNINSGGASADQN